MRFDIFGMSFSVLQERNLSDTLICPHCNETLWVAQMQVPLLTCPRCLGVIVNPNAASGARVIEPRQVIPIEEEAGFDLRGTVWGLLVLGLTLVVAGVGAVVVAKQSTLGVILIGAGLLTAGGVMLAKQRIVPREESLPPPAIGPGGVLNYAPAQRRVSVLAFLGGFIMAIVIGIICFYTLVATGDQTSVTTRRMVFSGMVVVIVGQILAAIQLRRRPGWAGFGRGVAIGLALAMMALGPCAACYVMTLFG